MQLIKYHVSSQKTYTFKCIKKVYFYIMHKFAIIIQWHAHVNTARVVFVNINGGPKGLKKYSNFKNLYKNAFKNHHIVNQLVGDKN